MGRKIIKVTAATPEEIQAIFKKDKRLVQGSRLNAVYKVSQGIKPQDLTDFYNVSFKCIINWVHRFNTEGISGLIDKPKQGRPSKLTPEQQEALKELVLNEDPQLHGYNSATWTGLMVIDYINKHYGILYKKAQIYNILKKMGLTYQKGNGIYAESNNKLRQEQLSDLKKTSRTTRVICSPI